MVKIVYYSKISLDHTGEQRAVIGMHIIT